MRKPDHALASVATALAAGVLELARLQVVEHRAWLAVDVALVVGGLWLAARFARGVAGDAVAVVSLAVWPLLAELLSRNMLGLGSPPEFVLLAAVRNLMLVLAWIVTSRKQPGAVSHRGLAVGMSLFVTLASLLFVPHVSVYLLASCYGAIGLWWLMGQSWERLRGRFAAQSRHEPPTWLRLTPVVLVALVAGLCGLTVVGSRASSAVAGLFYSSGGDRWFDPFASQGVNDGDMLVGATDEADSFGPVESDIFMTSDAPSLYDVVSDNYGKACPKKHQEAAIALGSDNVVFTEKSKSQTQQSGREFSAVRRRGRKAARLPNRPSEALVVVQGRVPLHLRLETFDTFDGREWSQAAGRAVATVARRWPRSGDRSYTRPWFTPHDAVTSELLGPLEEHRLKIINLRSTRIPTPEHLAGVHIDRVDRPEFFAWTSDEVLDMPDRERVPPLTVVHVSSQSVASPPRLPVGTAELLALPATARTDDLRRLADEWTAHLPAGWPQVEAIVSRLRSEFVHDPEYRVAEDCDDAVAEFLFESRRGPDYLFASAATLLLRSRGIPARTAMGLYANPDRYERLGRQTPVFRHDLHTWTEVLVDRRTWKTVEPTPGYEVLPPPRSVWQTAWAGIVTAGRWCGNHPWRVLGLIALLVALFAMRREALDRAAWLAWWFGQRLWPQRRVEFTLRLLETRASLAGRRRPPGATLRRWYAAIPTASEPSASLRRFLDLAAAALYGRSPEPSPENALACQRVVREWTWRAFATNSGHENSRSYARQSVA